MRSSVSSRYRPAFGSIQSEIGDAIQHVAHMERRGSRRQGLPKPAWISVRAASIFEGAPHARSMPDFSEGGAGLCKFQTHVVAEFEERVQGPVLVGRGRYRGYWLFRPVRPKEERSNE